MAAPTITIGRFPRARRHSASACIAGLCRMVTIAGRQRARRSRLLQPLKMCHGVRPLL
jgi:hypothetical protein